MANYYTNCKSAKNSVAKVVTYYPACNTGKEVHFYGDYESASEHYERTKKERIFQLGFERAELYFRGVGNKWIEMVAED